MEIKNYIENQKETRILESIDKGKKLNIVGKGLSFFAYLIAILFKKIDKNFLIILPNEKKCEKFYFDIINFVDKEYIKYLPAFEIFREETDEVSFERIKTLIKLSREKDKNMIVTYPLAVIKKIPKFSELKEKVCLIERNKELRRDYLINFLFNSGYEEREVVELPGEFARRGGIIDVFPIDSPFPIRINFDGNKIESIRRFEISSQKSFEKIENFELYPLSEFYSGEENSDIIEEIENKLIFLIYPDEIKDQYIEELTRNKDNIDFKILEKAKDMGFFLTEKIYSFSDEFILFNVAPTNERYKVLGEKVIWQQKKEESIFLFYENYSDVERLERLLKNNTLDYKFELIEGNISEGFTILENNITFLSLNEIFSRYKSKHPFLRRYRTLPLTEWSEIKEGDYVVHVNEGIGIFRGIEKIKVEGKEEEFVIIEYKDGDKLYVPVNQISLIHKYIGSNKPVLSKLGSKNWRRIKEKVKNSIRDIVFTLYKLYTERRKEKGYKFPADDELQREFEEEFIYEETPDQLKTIEEVKNDMMSEKIMDRLICGDSGYGKTEVAMRAAFKAVLAGKQVIVLVPTTVLALQHYLTFKERFSKFPVIIEMLSRLIPEKKQKEIIERIKTGNIDIIIGTHRLLQDDVKFKSPGLLIIDEEQRFGVLQKERIKILFPNIDVLTLTATPIPRTLNMALSGLKDISLIETPPEGRLNVITYVGPYNENLVKTAILNEIERNGQVFYLHNYIYDIHKVKEKLQRLVPLAKIDIAHGRMDPVEIADVMKRFSSGKIQVLVATTIVENGLDIPNANTLIVDNALKYGISDLYQLRGRVGRYKYRAYAYFFYPSHIPLNKKAIERLKAIQEFTNSGSGFKIALKDLEIRGAGNILGKEQHGFIEMVGFDLYCQFWREVVGEIKGEKRIEKRKEIKIEVPEDYVKTPSLRFYLYREIAKIKNRKEAEELVNDLIDKFGYIPEILKNQILSLF